MARSLSLNLHSMRTEATPIPLPENAGNVMLTLARTAIAREFGKNHRAVEDAAWLSERGACFITLTYEQKLRGCIGTLRAHRTLLEDVQANAVAAAFRDPRFKPLAVGEFDAVAVEVSVLSDLAPMTFADEQDALAQLRADIDGVVFQYGHHSSTFLPQVWENLREPAEFMAHLKYKAGLPPDFWHPEVTLARYTVSKWRETGNE
jgi:AmmeMemoRadiSam system protein A